MNKDLLPPNNSLSLQTPTNALPLLYTFRRCPYAMRASMAIYAAQLPVIYQEVSLKNKPPGLLEASPKGTVPVLITPDGKVIEQSRDIMLWALEQSDPMNWLESGNAQDEMNQLIDCCDVEFKPLLDRYKYFERYPENSQQEYRERAEGFLQLLEKRLGEHRFLINDAMGCADVAIFPFIRQFAGVDPDWFAASAYKKLGSWLNGCVNSEVFIAVMKK